MKINKNQKGFFVIEAIVAMIVFLTGVLGVLQIQTASITTVSDSQYRVNAAYLAGSILGQMQVDKANIANYAAGSGTEYTNWLNEVKSSMPGVSQNLPTITLTPISSGNQITVTIFWKSPINSVVQKHTSQTTIF